MCYIYIIKIIQNILYYNGRISSNILKIYQKHRISSKCIKNILEILNFV